MSTLHRESSCTPEGEVNQDVEEKEASPALNDEVETDNDELDEAALEALPVGSRAYYCAYVGLDVTKRWILLSKDLKLMGKSDEEIEAYFEDFYRAYYFLMHDSSSTAMYFRGLHDIIHQHFKGTRTPQTQGVPLITVLLFAFFSMGNYKKGLGEMIDLPSNLEATLQVLLPGMPLPSQGISTRMLFKCMQLIGDSELKALICAISMELQYLLEGLRFKAPEFNRQTARDNFPETSNVLDMLGSLDALQIPFSDLMKRFGKYIHRRTVLATNLEDKEHNTFIDYLYHGANKRLNSVQLPDLTEDQSYLLLLDVLCRLPLSEHAILCENKSSQIDEQKKILSHDLLKEEGPRLLDQNFHFEPDKIFPLRNMQEVFASNVCDLMNEYIMPLTDDSSHQNYEQEKMLTDKVMQKVIAGTTPDFQAFLRAPKIVSDLEHETITQYCISMFDMKHSVDMGSNEFKGKKPVQGWRSLIVVTSEELPAAFCRNAMIESEQAYKEQFEQLMMNAMTYDDLERQISTTMKAKGLKLIDAINHIQHTIDMRSYDRQRQFAIINGRLSGVIRSNEKAPKNSYMIPGLVKTMAAGTLIDGDELLKLETHPEKQTLVQSYISSLEVNAENFMDVACVVDPCVDFLGPYYKQSYGDEHYGYSIELEKIEYRSLNELQSSYISMQRMLNTRQVRSQDLILQNNIREALVKDPYYDADAFVLFAQSIASLILDRKNKIW